MKLYMARHGETDLNIDDRYQGRIDLPLNAHGQAQATALAAALPAQGIQQLYASPQLRAQQTAAAVAQRLGLPIQTLSDLREKDFGVLEGLTPAEVAAQHPALWQAGVLTSWDLPLPDGETTRAVVSRVAGCLARIHQDHPDDTVLLVVHGFVIRALRYLIDGLPEAEFFTAPRLGNAEFLVRERVRWPA